MNVVDLIRSHPEKDAHLFTPTNEKELNECLKLPEKIEELNKADDVLTDDVEWRDFVIKMYVDEDISMQWYEIS